MKSTRTQVLWLVVCLTVIVLVTGPSARAYPPENAAVLYYKAYLVYEVDDERGRILTDFAKGRAKVSDEVRALLKENRRAMDIVLNASEVKSCDWGFDYSQGCDMLAPPYHPLRQLAMLIVADARILAQEGDYRSALGRCTALYRTARHVNDGILISHLVGIALEALANDCVIGILSEMPEDKETLRWLKGELAKIAEAPLSVQPALDGEREANLISMSPEKLTKALDSGIDKRFRDMIAKSIRDKDEEFFQKNREYWKNYIGRIEAAFDLPYAKAHSELKRLAEELLKESEKNRDAVLTAAFCPTMARICTLSVRSRTHFNAVRAGIEVYAIKASKGRLPDTLPSGLPQDLFSGKAFEYEKAGNGFVLRCQGKDLDKDTTYSYEFKVKR
jgi:hypothetical protein